MADSRIFSQYAPEPVPFMDIGQLAHGRQVRQINELKLEQAKREAEAQRQADEAAAQEQQLLQQAFSQFRREDGMPDEEQIVTFLYPTSPKLAESVQTSFTKLRKDAAEAQKSEWDNEAKRSTEIAQIVNGATPEQWPSVAARVRAKDPTREIPQTFDPAWVEMTVREGTSVPEQTKLFKDLIDRSKDATTTMLGGLSASTTPAQWQTWLDYGRVERANPAVIQAVGETFSPEAARNAAALSMTPEKRAEMDAKAAEAKALAADRDADNRRQNMTAAETARHNRVMEQRTASEPLESVIGPDGKPVLLRRSQAEGRTPATTREQPSEDERKSAGFYRQMQEAIAILDEVEGQLSTKDLYQIQTLPQEQLVGMINRGEMSEAAKRYMRAFEQFTEARMRPVSGAAISDSEFARDRRTYAKQYAETPQLAADRKKARNTALESLKDRAMRALPKTDDAKTGAVQREIPGFPGAIAESTDGGKTWKRVK